MIDEGTSRHSGRKIGDLLPQIERWQQEAISLKMPVFDGIPQDKQRKPARGRLAGPAFFPEGSGFPALAPGAPIPRVMVIGQNFGSEEYRASVERSGREDDQRTWLGLRWLLNLTNVPIVDCYMTNWFVGLLRGKKQEGLFLLAPDCDYESACHKLLLDQSPNYGRVSFSCWGEKWLAGHGPSCRLTPWQKKARWRDIDSALAPVQYEVPVQRESTEMLRATVVALLHPARAAANQSGGEQPQIKGYARKLKCSRRAMKPFACDAGFDRRL